MWDQTVTVYRKEGQSVSRRVVSGCVYRYSQHQQWDERGIHRQTKFLLVIPGEDPIRPGDRVLEGEGPQVSAEQWPEFLPANIQSLAQVAYVRPCRWNDHIAHTEAGRK